MDSLMMINSWRKLKMNKKILSLLLFFVLMGTVSGTIVEITQQITTPLTIDFINNTYFTVDTAGDDKSFDINNATDTTWDVIFDFSFYKNASTIEGCNPESNVHDILASFEEYNKNLTQTCQSFADYINDSKSYHDIAIEKTEAHTRVVERYDSCKIDKDLAEGQLANLTTKYDDKTENYLSCNSNLQSCTSSYNACDTEKEACKKNIPLWVIGGALLCFGIMKYFEGRKHATASEVNQFGGTREGGSREAEPPKMG